MEYKNYTGMNVVIFDEQGNQITTITPEENNNIAYNSVIDNKEVLDDNVTLIDIHYDILDGGLPVQTGLLYIVSPHIKSLFPDRQDIITPDFETGAIRNENGSIIGFKYFIR